MSISEAFYPGRRISYDGALCTVRCIVPQISGTKGEWLGVEWDELLRGKHDGKYNGVTYFQCRSSLPSTASFVRPARKNDSERTVLQAIKFKYVADISQSNANDLVTISGKVAEEVGFEKLAKAQSVISDLKVAVLDQLAIIGVATRGASVEEIRQAQQELASECPNIIELDLSYNVLETWADVESICTALPKLRILKLNGQRFRSLESFTESQTHINFPGIRELYLSECLLDSSDILRILQTPHGPRFPDLRDLWLSQNELRDIQFPASQLSTKLESIKNVMLDNNQFKSLASVESLASLCPNSSYISLQNNQIVGYDTKPTTPDKQYPAIASLNLTMNAITSWSFIDALPGLFPSLSSLRISKNPVYDGDSANASVRGPSEVSYYLTLARIPNLKTLNYTEITTRDREEGEIYYLSTSEKQIQNKYDTLDPKTPAPLEALATSLTKLYPSYHRLCKKHDRDDLITQLTSNPSTHNQKLSTAQQQVHPLGSLASRIVETTFHISPKHSPRSNAPNKTTIVAATAASENTPSPVTFTHLIPNTIPTASIYALVSRNLHLKPLSFKLVYESEELDPVRDDTTRSQMYTDRGKNRWDDWGDWDADALVEKAAVALQESKRRAHMDADVDMDMDMRVEAIDDNLDGLDEGLEGLDENEGKWNDEGILVKDGRRWKRREIDVLFGMRRWGDWLESDVRVCRVRVDIVDPK